MFYVSYVTQYDFQEVYSTSIENVKQFLGLKFFCMILVWFLGIHIWPLYDHQEFIQIIYDQYDY